MAHTLSPRNCYIDIVLFVRPRIEPFPADSKMAVPVRKVGTMIRTLVILLFTSTVLLTITSLAVAQECINCHKEDTPGIVTDWTISARSDNGVDCSTCHGSGHISAEDTDNVLTVTAETCAECHDDRVAQFKSGKHALAWAAMNAMPTTYHKPMEFIAGMKGYDACHTRHTFSLQEARDPRACATCHMPEGNHEVRTPWGFLALRTNGLEPCPGEDEQWWANRVSILQALGVLDPSGNPTGRLDVVAQADVARLSAEAFDKERAEMISICSDCHSENFAKAELEKGDKMIREADCLLAEAIRIIAGLYEDGTLQKPENYTYAFPDLLTFHGAPAYASLHSSRIVDDCLRDLC